MATDMTGGELATLAACISGVEPEQVCQAVIIVRVHDPEVPHRYIITGGCHSGAETIRELANAINVLAKDGP